MPTADDFATMILDNLKQAGVQNTRKDERLSSTGSTPLPGELDRAPRANTPRSDGNASGASPSSSARSTAPSAADWCEAATEARRGVASTC